MSIDWTAFGWGDFATLVTGALAVGAAIYVGRRQAGISETQATIQREQTAIQREQTAIQREQVALQTKLVQVEELTLRSDLFERRVAIYDATKEWLEWVITYGKPPGFQINGEPPTPESIGVRLAFYQGVDRARFLFRPEVFRRLESLVKDGHLILHSMRGAQRARSQEARDKFVDDEHHAFSRLGMLQGDLSRVFGDELSLSVHGSVWDGEELDLEEDDDQDFIVIEPVAAEAIQAPAPAAPQAQ